MVLLHICHVYLRRILSLRLQKGTRGREKLLVMRTFSLVNKGRWGLWKDLSVLMTCLALYPFLKALLCSFFHCFALSCWRDENAVYSLVLGWENCRKS